MIETPNRKEHDLDLGDNHWLSFTIWKPNREINPQLAHLPDDDHIGGIISHLKPDGTLCEGSIWFEGPVTKEVFANHPRWTVTGPWEQMTCNPSFLCHCGDHGFIRDGKWVRA
jgi:hypothetical protein